MDKKINKSDIVDDITDTSTDKPLSAKQGKLLSSRIDNLSTLSEGSTTGDAELTDIRVGVDGTTYDTAGKAVREQINELTTNINNCNDSIVTNVQSIQENTDNIISLNKDLSNIVKHEYVGCDFDKCNINLNHIDTRFSAYTNTVVGKIDKVFVKSQRTGIAKIIFAIPTNNDKFIPLFNFESYLSEGDNTLSNDTDFTYEKDIPIGTIIGIYAVSDNQSSKIAYYNNTDFEKGGYRYSIGDFSIVSKETELTVINYDIAIAFSVISSIKSDVVKLQNINNKNNIGFPNIDGETFYCTDGDVISVQFRLNELQGKLILYRDKKSESTGSSRIDFVDFENSKIGFYTPLSNVDDVTSSSFTPLITTSGEKTKTLELQFIVGHEYLAESIRYSGANSIIRITDMYTLESEEYKYENSTSNGTANGYRGIRTDLCNISVVKKTMYSNQPVKPKVLIIGDSYVEGSSIATQKDKRWSALLKSDLNNDVFINGMGGKRTSDGLNWLKGYIPKLCSPQYVIVQLGTNDSDFEVYKSNMTEIINVIKTEMFATPILVQIPPNNAGSKNIYTDINEFVRSSGELYINECNLMTLNYDGVTQNTNLYKSDLIHPNIEGHTQIYQRIRREIPQLFI